VRTIEVVSIFYYIFVSLRWILCWECRLEAFFANLLVLIFLCFISSIGIRVGSALTLSREGLWSCLVCNVKSVHLSLSYTERTWGCPDLLGEITVGYICWWIPICQIVDNLHLPGNRLEILGELQLTGSEEKTRKTPKRNWMPKQLDPTKTDLQNFLVSLFNSCSDYTKLVILISIPSFIDSLYR